MTGAIYKAFCDRYTHYHHNWRQNFTPKIGLGVEEIISDATCAFITQDKTDFSIENENGSRKFYINLKLT